MMYECTFLHNYCVNRDAGIVGVICNTYDKKVKAMTVHLQAMQP